MKHLRHHTSWCYHSTSDRKLINLYRNPMHKESSENIYNILLDIRESIGVLKAKSGEHDIKFDQLITQTTRTNGRVTKLEDNFTIISNAHAKLIEMASKQNGIYEQNMKIIEDNVLGCSREIDELKKKVNAEEVSDTQLESVKITESSKVKVAIYGGIFTIVGSLITFLITFYSK